MTTIVAPPNNANKWQIGFNSAFKGLMHNFLYSLTICLLTLLSSTRFEHEHAHLLEEKLYSHSIWYPSSGIK